MNRRFAYFLSLVFHPVLMPTYALIIILGKSTYYFSTMTNDNRFDLFVIILVNTLVLPVVISYMLVKKGWIKSLEMQKREERMFPYFINLALMLSSTFLIYKLNLPRLFFQLTMGAAAAISIAIIINIKWKISIHMIGIGALIGTFFGMSTFLMIDLRMMIIVFLVIAGLLGTARISLGAHRPSHIYSGFFTGFICEYLLLSV